MVTTEWLNHRADQIEDFLCQKCIYVDITGGEATPRGIVFQVQARIGMKVSRISALAPLMAQKANAEWCQVVRRGALIYIGFPPLVSATTQTKLKARHESARLRLRQHPFTTIDYLMDNYHLPRERAETLSRRAIRSHRQKSEQRGMIA